MLKMIVGKIGSGKTSIMLMDAMMNKKKSLFVSSEIVSIDNILGMGNTDNIKLQNVKRNLDYVYEVENVLIDNPDKEIYYFDSCIHFFNGITKELLKEISDKYKKDIVVSVNANITSDGYDLTIKRY